MNTKKVVVALLSDEGTYAIEHNGKFLFPWKSFNILGEVIFFLKQKIEPENSKSVAVIVEEHIVENLPFVNFANCNNVVISQKSCQGLANTFCPSYEDALQIIDEEIVFVLGGENLWEKSLCDADEIVVCVISGMLKLGKDKKFPKLLNPERNYPEFSFRHSRGEFKKIIDCRGKTAELCFQIYERVIDGFI